MRALKDWAYENGIQGVIFDHKRNLPKPDINPEDYEYAYHLKSTIGGIKMDKKHVIIDMIECILFIIYFLLDIFWHPSTNIGKIVMLILGIIVTILAIVAIVQSIKSWNRK